MALFLKQKVAPHEAGGPLLYWKSTPEPGWSPRSIRQATDLSVALGDFSAHILDETERPFRIADGPKHCLEEADRGLKSILEKNDANIADLSAIGLSVPGPVITDTGMVMAPPIMPGWDRFPIRTTLENLWKVPVTLNNDANFGALGEWVYGAGRGEEEFRLY